MTNFKETMYNLVALTGIAGGSVGVLNYFIESNLGREPNPGYLFNSISLITTAALLRPDKKRSELEAKVEE